MTTQDIVDYYRGSGSVYEEFAALPQPTIAAITGYCLGGGLELALAADIRIADPAAVFGLPEIDIGILPSSGGLTRIARAVGSGRARDLVLRGRRFDARQAERWGIVTEFAARRAPDARYRRRARADQVLRAGTAHHQTGLERQPRRAAGGRAAARTAGLLGAQRSLGTVRLAVGKTGGVVGESVAPRHGRCGPPRTAVALSALHAGQTPSRPRRFQWMWSNDRHGGQGRQQAGARTGRERIQKLAQAALNADVTVDQVDAFLAGLGETLEDLNNSTGNLDATLERFNDTISRINELAPRLNAVVDRLEGIVDRVERIVGIGEAAMAPLAATESAVRGAINAVRRTTRI